MSNTTDYDRLRRAAAETEERYASWAEARLRPSGAEICPRVVAGRRCVAFRSDGRRCICERLTHPVLDHARMWLTPDGGHVLTFEPYSLSTDNLAALAELSPLGLELSISGYSPWNPGATFLCTITKPKENP